MSSTIMVSGGFDPLHVGHLNLLKCAALYGPVVVALNSDCWLHRKKGYVVMPWINRSYILDALTVVEFATHVQDSDGTVCEALRRIKPAYFANGGDRTKANPREHAVCEEMGIEELFDVGGSKVQSSSALFKDACKYVTG